MILPTTSMLIASTIMAVDDPIITTYSAIMEITSTAHTNYITNMMTTSVMPLHPSPHVPLSVLNPFYTIFTTADANVVTGNNNNNDLWTSISAAFAQISSITNNYAIPDNPSTILSTIAFVTASDMIPFLPCQPLAISLGAKYGLWAFPMCLVGQTLAGIIAFQSSRKISDTEKVKQLLESLGEDGNQQFQKFRNKVLFNSNGGGSRVDEVGKDIDAEEKVEVDERTVFFALVGLRLAPFFPFSAGNYLLGGATNVSIRPFVLATILGCLASNAVSVLVGMGGAELFTLQSSSLSSSLDCSILPSM